MVETVFPFLKQAAPVALLLLVAAVAFVHHYHARQLQAQGVLWLQALRMLITHIQRHRGLSSGALAGDHVLQQKLSEMQQQVSRDFEQIGGIGEWIKNNSSWQGITQHWARLAGNIYRLTIPRSLDQHNRLIKSILVLVDDIALAHHLHNGSSFKANIWRDLLTLAEYIGQVRAIGTALTAHGYNWDDGAHGRARHDLQALDQDIIALLEAPRCRSALDPKCLQEILDFLSYVDCNILCEGPIVSAADFYNVATTTLDKLYERFDEELAEINCRLIH